MDPAYREHAVSLGRPETHRNSTVRRLWSRRRFWSPYENAPVRSVVNTAHRGTDSHRENSRTPYLRARHRDFIIDNNKE